MYLLLLMHHDHVVVPINAQVVMALDLTTMTIKKVVCEKICFFFKSATYNTC
jgi:hypothetical protein